MVRHLLLVVAVGCSSHLPETPEPRWPAAGQARDEAPFTLTASDGSGLRLARLDAKAVIEGPLAFTELHLYFHNDEDRVREGQFAIALPARAAVSRFAMQIGEQMQEAEVVAKQMARRTYEDFLHRRQDPALLEKAAGNEFTARVFPIPARAEKHLVISFSQELVGEYVLPLRGLPSIGQIDVELEVTRADGTRVTQQLHERDWRPDRDFAAGVMGPTAVGNDDLVALQLIHGAASEPDVPRALTLIVDTSASRALGFARYLDAIGELVAMLASRYADPAIKVIAFDQETQAIYDGPASGFGNKSRELLLARGAAGASDLGQALATIAPNARVVVITDGVVTAGEERPALATAARRFERLDIVLAGGIRDDGVASALAHAGKRAGDVHDLDRGASGVAIGLGERVRTDVAVTVEGASWSYPRKVPALRAGSDPVIVYARLPRPTSVVTAALGDDRRALAVTPGTRVLLARAIASAEIGELEQRLANGDDAELRSTIEQRSVAARVVSSQTAMLVLETEQDYERYRIPRTALADILVVRDHGIAATRRSKIVVDTSRIAENEDFGGTTSTMQLDEGAMGKPDRVEGQYKMQRVDDVRRSREQAIEAARTAGILDSTSATNSGYSSLTADANFGGRSGFGAGGGDISTGFDDKNIYGGLLGNEAGEMNGGFGSGRSGFGPGGGGAPRVAGARAAAPPTVAIGQPTTSGSLDKSIIRRYIKRHTAKIAYCYERELLGKPQLAGRLLVQFTIEPTGNVAKVTATGVDPTVARCVVDVVQTIEFPRVDGTVIVNYPFTFRRVGTESVPTPTTPEPPVPTSPVLDRTALTGKLADVMAAIAQKRVANALQIAKAWRGEAPGDVLALIALGEALEADHQIAAAARMYGSLIDLFPGRADLRRFAGERLERVANTATTRRLAIDTYRRAVADRPDHITGHRLLAHALLRGGDHAGAFAAILTGIDQAVQTPGADRILREDAGIIASVYLAKGGPRAEIQAELTERDLTAITQPSTRFLLYWETDANDVDFHIRDARGEEAYYSQPKLASGGELYADVTTGYGPECFAIRGKPKAGPYQLSIHYFSQGPMGYGMGLLQIQRFDGKTVTFEDRPYVIMVDRGSVDLGSAQ